MGAQPSDEVEHLRVAPHPCREPAESPQRLLGVAVRAAPGHVAPDAGGVGPVALDRHTREPLLHDQPSRYPGPFAVELVGAVAGLAEQDHAGVADQLQQHIMLSRAARQLVGIAPDRPGAAGLR